MQCLVMDQSWKFSTFSEVWTESKYNMEGVDKSVSSTSSTTTVLTEYTFYVTILYKKSPKVMRGPLGLSTRKCEVSACKNNWIKTGEEAENNYLWISEMGGRKVTDPLCREAPHTPVWIPVQANKVDWEHRKGELILKGLNSLISFLTKLQVNQGSMHSLS